MTEISTSAQQHPINMQTPSTQASILKPIHSRRRRTPGTICLCAIDPATCPQCTRPAETQSPRAEAPQTRTVTFAPAVQICHFQQHDAPRRVADDTRIAADTPRSTEVSPSDAQESTVHDDCSIPRMSSAPTKDPAEPSASPNQGTKLGKSLAALVHAHPRHFRGSATAALAIARDRALVTHAEAADSRLPIR